jgi:hypothetical protein
MWQKWLATVALARYGVSSIKLTGETDSVAMTIHSGEGVWRVMTLCRSYGSWRNEENATAWRLCQPGVISYSAMSMKALNADGSGNNEKNSDVLQYYRDGRSVVAWRHRVMAAASAGRIHIETWAISIMTSQQSLNGGIALSGDI